MLRFTLNSLQLGRTTYLVLPKLNTSQLALFAERLAKKGFTIEVSGPLVARRKGHVIRIARSGLCWSSSDPSDAIAPAIPGILEATTEKISLDDLRGLYFHLGRAGGSVAVKLATRMESSSLWQTLRRNGECALTPDERDAVLFVVRNSSGRCNLITDFPTEGAIVRTMVGRQYYESSLDIGEISSTLRTVGEKRPRNSYLPKSGILRFKSVNLPPRYEQARFFEALGEWSGLRPK